MDWGYFIFDKFVLLLILLIALKIGLGMISRFVMATIEYVKSQKDDMIPKIGIAQGFGLIMKEAAPHIGAWIGDKLRGKG